jgi:hypothetical protein
MSRRRTLAAPRFDDKRPPLERLASLVHEPGIERAQRMMLRISEELIRTPEPGPWIAAARTLAAQSVITENALVYLVEQFLECITMDAIGHDPEMMRIEEEIERVKRQHGLGEDDDWYVHEGPPEWQELTAAWDQRDDELRVATLRALGHGELAELRERDLEEYQSRSDAGHSEFWGDREA